MADAPGDLSALVCANLYAINKIKEIKEYKLCNQSNVIWMKLRRAVQIMPNGLKSQKRHTLDHSVGVK